MEAGGQHRRPYHLSPDCLLTWTGGACSTPPPARAPPPTLATRQAALTEAVDAWGGLLYHNKYEWIEPNLETCRQYGLAIHTQLAEPVADRDPRPARDLLQAA